MSWCQMLSTVHADDLHRISRHRTTDPRCRREAQRQATIRAALEHATIGVRIMTLSELKAQVALSEDSRCQFKLKRGASAGRKFGEEFGEGFGENFIFS